MSYDDERAYVLTHHRIASFEMTCPAVPEQYEGILMDGQMFYFRLRFSCATLGVGPTLDDAIQDSWRRPHLVYEPEPIAAPGWTGKFDSDADANRHFADLIEDIP